LPGPSQPSIRAVSPRPSGGYWQLRLAPGQAVELAALVANAGKSVGTFRLGATGAGTGPTTGVGYTLGAGLTASWLTGLPTRVTLQPGQGVVVHAKLRVPPSAKPSFQYVGGLEALGAASTPVVGKHKASVSIAQRNAAVVAWVVTTGAPKKAVISFGMPQVGASSLPAIVFPAANTGQVLFAPKVLLSVRAGACGPRLGRLEVSTTRQWLTTVPGTSWAYPVYLGSVLPAGTYCAVERALPGRAQERTFRVSRKQQRVESQSPGLAHVLPPPVAAGPSIWLLLGVALLATLVVLLLVLLSVALSRDGRR
jgi:hypothetical protein